jgi:LysR family transcriptional regulator (chromosome initiation inhibitor)
LNKCAGCTSTALGAIEYDCIARPDIIQQYFTKGVTKAGISKATMIIFNHKDLLLDQYLDHFFGIDANQQLVPSSEGYLEWILPGMVFGMAPKIQMQHLLEAG